MKTKSIIKSGLEVMNDTQLGKVKGGKKIIIIKDGVPVVIEIAD